VLGIPRGGVVVAAEAARILGARLDVAVARKLPAPGHPELAIGAVTAAGGLLLDTAAIELLHVPQEYLRRTIESERAEAQRREREFRGAATPPSLVDKVVIVVDDGLATGATMRAALRTLRAAMPRLLVAAAPVGSPDGCRAARLEADEVVCPFQLPGFGAVGAYYLDFTQTTDREVHELLERSHDSPLAEMEHPR
jgi:predicted phosphoribosyltransferase